MRVTTGMLQQNLLRNIRNDMSLLADAQRKVATGMRIDEASDDPVAAAHGIVGLPVLGWLDRAVQRERGPGSELHVAG